MTNIFIYGNVEVMIIGITGVARCGKDTFYAILKKYLEERQIKSQRLAFADDLKKELNDFTKEKFKIFIAYRFILVDNNFKIIDIFV